MKTGKDLPTLAAELKRRAEAKQDFIADTREIDFSSDFKRLMLKDVSFNITPHAHGQIAEHAGIPKKYYDKMLTERPDLARTNVRTWFAQTPARRMVRTLDGSSRAFLSDRYRRLDNEDVAQAALRSLLEKGLGEVVSCEVTDTRLYIKALFPGRVLPVKVGDEVQGGVVISNSEIGAGALSVSLFVNRLICLNGMISGSTLRQAHLGGRVEGDGVTYRDETVQADDRALMLKLEDVITATAGEPFQLAVDRMRTAAGSSPLGNPIKAMEVLAMQRALPQAEKDSILERLIKGGDYTAWGVANAVTSLAGDTASYDRATELEMLGGQLIQLPANDWQEMAKAA